MLLLPRIHRVGREDGRRLYAGGSGKGEPSRVILRRYKMIVFFFDRRRGCDLDITWWRGIYGNQARIQN